MHRRVSCGLTLRTEAATPTFTQGNDEEDEEDDGCGGAPPHPSLSPPVAVVTVEPRTSIGLMSAVLG